MSKMKEHELINTSETAGQTAWIKACSTSSVPANEGVCVKIKDKQIAVFNFTKTGEWFASDNLCPHKMQMILSRGMLGDQAGEPKVACPYHKKTFSLHSGTCLSGEDYSIKTYPIQIENEEVFIKI